MPRLEKKLHTLKLLALSIFFSSAAFCAAELADPSPEELTRTYLKYLPHSPEAMKTPMDSAEKGITHIARILKQMERLEHSYHVKNKPSYGCSFTTKNEPPIQLIVHAITGKKSWKKEMLESLDSPITIADVGCGLGFSTISVVLQTLEIYEKDSWELKAPINIDLYDISSEHEEPLTALAALINMAFPKYFRIRIFVHDATQPFPVQNYYRLAMGLNFMHYVPQTNWALVLKNLENSMKKDGMLFLTVDHYLSGLSSKEDVDTLEAAIKRVESPFIIPSVHLLKKDSGKEVATQTANLSLFQIIKEEADEAKLDDYQQPQKMSSCIPGKSYRFDEINIKNFQTLLETMLRKKTKPSDKDLPEAQIQIIVKAMLGQLPLGNLWIQLGCYRFNEKLFEKALKGSLGKGSKLAEKPLEWTTKLPLGIDGSPSSVGITLVKG